MTPRDEREARAALSAAVEPGTTRVLGALPGSSARSVHARLTAGDVELDPDGRIARRLRGVDPEAVLATAARAGVRLVVPDDPDWPATLGDLHGRERDGRGGPPLGLWAIGSIEAVTQARCAAVVGSRAATAYGVGVAADWAAALAEHGFTVVSGAAYGIDAAAHRGALAVGGTTVAVLAGGVDEPYPRGNATLIQAIGRDGCLLSEAAPGSVVNRGRFLVRNRLIAALAGMVLVVEAGSRSGALSTARWAVELLRPVGAVPGPVTSSLSLGTHQLVREYGAVLVSRPEEVVELVGDLGVDAALPVTAPSRPTDDLTGPARSVHEALPARGPVTVAELMGETGLTVAAVLAGLTDLAGRGLVDGAGEQWRRVPPRRRDP